MSDQVGLAAPSGNVFTIWQDGGSSTRDEPAGARFGLGCSSNGTVAACTYGGWDDNLVVYRGNGSIVYRKTELGSSAWTSAPMVDSTGGVIAADQSHIYRYGPTGVRYWRTSTPGGTPISPVMTASGVVVLATNNGPLSTYRTTDGAFLDDLDLGFDTVNTPGVSGNRIYVSVEQGASAKLAAVDVSSSGQLTDGWGSGSFAFDASSGASPAVRNDRIYFDGHDGSSTYVFCVRDDGGHATELWRYPMADEVTASLALDPRGGVWTYALNNPELIRLGDHGLPLDVIDLDALVGGSLTYTPSSVMTLAGTASQPVMIVSARGVGSLKTYVVAIDLVSKSLQWKRSITPWSDSTAAQFAIVRQGAKPRVVFPTYFGGAQAIGAL